MPVYTHLELVHDMVAPAPTPNPAPRFLTGACWNDVVRRRAHKLTRHDVAEIRRWARSDGFGLSQRQQARLLHTNFGVKEATICEVLRNETWYDPSYVWSDRLPGTLPDATPGGAAWLVHFLLWWKLTMGML